MMYMFCTKLSITRLNVILFILYLPSQSSHLNEPGEETDPVRLHVEGKDENEEEHYENLKANIYDNLVYLM